MRITDSILQKNFISNLNLASERLYEKETRVLTNKQINKPSDNPVDTMTALTLRSKISEIEQFQRNITRSQTLLQNTDSMTSQLSDLYNRINSLTVQGASDSYTLSDKTSISYEINQIIEQVLNIANSRSENIFTFAGTNNSSAPYQPVRNEAGEIVQVQTSGSKGDINTVIGENIQIKMNVNGEDVFERGENLFEEAIRVRDDLRSGNSDSLRQDLIRLNTISEKLINTQSIIGSRMNRIEAAGTRAENDILSFTEYLSKTEDADASQAIMDYQQELVTLQSSLQAGSRLLYPKLTDFLK